MNRELAIRIISVSESESLSREERELTIYNIWGLNESDNEFYLLPRDLREELMYNDEPQEDIMENRYDILVELACEDSYKQFSNDKLQEMVSYILERNIEVYGNEPVLYACPCCGKKTLTYRGEYDICPNCNWEDDGNDEEDRYSSPNHMTLNQGKINYLKFGSSKNKN